MANDNVAEVTYMYLRRSPKSNRLNSPQNTTLSITLGWNWIKPEGVGVGVGWDGSVSEWVLSKFNGTLTPKGSYRAKTGDNDCNVNSSRYSLSTALCESIRYQAIKSEQNVRQDLIPRVRHGEAALCTPKQRVVAQGVRRYDWRYVEMYIVIGPHVEWISVYVRS